MGRIIGIQHRTKRTAAGEARPTLVCVLDLETNIRTEHELATETDELDFARGQWPKDWRRVVEGEDITKFKSHHVQMKKVEDGEVPYKVPAGYDGFKAGDTIVMLLGGSGDRFAYALARNGEAFGGLVMRVPAFNLSTDGETTDGHHVRLVDLFLTTPQAFRQVARRDMRVMNVAELQRDRTTAMKNRIACEQQLRQRVIGRTFFTDGDYPEGKLEDQYDSARANDEGLAVLMNKEARCLSDLEKAVKALDVWKDIFAGINGCGVSIVSGLIAAIGNVSRFLRSEEMAELLDNRRKIAILDAKADRSAYAKKLEIVDGENHFERTVRIRKLMLVDGRVDEAAYLQETLNLMQRNYEIRRRGANRFKKYCGVHLINGWAECSDCGHQFDAAKHAISEGCTKCHSINVAPKAVFARRRAGVVANWNPIARQALYLLGEQYYRRPDSDGGRKLRAYKEELRLKYPVPVVVGTTKRYTPIHLHRMSRWRPLTRFAEWLFNRWLDVELNAVQKEKLEV